MDQDLSDLSSPRSRYLTQKLFFDPHPHLVHHGNGDRYNHNHNQVQGNGRANGSVGTSTSAKFDEMNLDARHRSYVLQALRHFLGVSVPSRGLYTGRPGGVGAYNVGDPTVQNERVVVVNGRNKTRQPAVAAGGGDVVPSPPYQQQHPDLPTHVSRQGQGQGIRQGWVDDSHNNTNNTHSPPNSGNDNNNNNMALNILNRPTTNLKYMNPEAVTLLADNHKDSGSDKDMGADKEEGSDKDKHDEMNHDNPTHVNDLAHDHVNTDTLSLVQPDLHLDRSTINHTHLLTPIALNKFKQQQGQGLSQGQGLEHDDGVVMISDEEEKGNELSESPHHNLHNHDHNHHPSTSTPTTVNTIIQNHLLHNLLARPTANPALQQLLGTHLGDTLPGSRQDYGNVLASSSGSSYGGNILASGNVSGGNVTKGNASVTPSRPDSPLHTNNLYNGRTKEMRRDGGEGNTK